MKYHTRNIAEYIKLNSFLLKLIVAAHKPDSQYIKKHFDKWGIWCPAIAVVCVSMDAMFQDNYL